MAANKENYNRGYFGPPGSGKTTAALKDHSRRKRVIRLDSTRQDMMAAGACVCNTLAELVAAILDGEQVICFRGVERPETRETVFNEVCRIAKAAPDTWLLVIDELQRLIAHGAMQDHVSDVMERGRHHKVQVVWTCLKPTILNPEIRSYADTMYFFAGVEKTYLDYAKAVGGNNLVDDIKKLSKYQAIVFTNDGTWKKKV